MKNLTYIQPQQCAKSVDEFTPYEIFVINQYQDRNRGFIDNEDEDLEVINWDYEN